MAATKPIPSLFECNVVPTKCFEEFISENDKKKRQKFKYNKVGKGVEYYKKIKTEKVVSEKVESDKVQHENVENDKVQNGNDEQETAEKETFEDCTIFVANIPFRIPWTDVKEFFSKFGSVTYVRYIKRIQGKLSQGTAFVRFDSASGATSALDASEEELTFQARLLRVRDTKNRKKGKKKFTLPDQFGPKEIKFDSTEQSDETEDDITGESPISVLNDECLSSILTFIEPVARVQLERVSKTWRRCVLLAARRQKCLVLRKPVRFPCNYLSEFKICRVIRYFSSSLAVLDLSHVGQLLKKTTIETIATSCHQLTTLDITGAVNISNHGLIRMIDHNTNLTFLSIANCPRLTENAVWSVFSYCRRLQELRCEGNRFLGKCLRIAPASLARLSIRNCPSVSEAALFHLSRNFQSLQTFQLNNCEMTCPSKVGEVFKNCSNLEEVDIGHFYASTLTSGAEEVVTRPHMVQCFARPEILTRLKLDETRLCDEDLLFVCSRCVEVRELDISCNGLTDLSVAQLSALTKLQALSICHLFNLTNSSLMELVQRGQLTSLRMQGCKLINDELFVELAACCKDLEELDIAGVVNATSRTWSALCDAARDRKPDQNKLLVYALHNAFLEGSVPKLPDGMSLCIIYRRLYASHARWVAEEDNIEPHNIVLDRGWQPGELDKCLQLEHKEEQVEQEEEEQQQQQPSDGGWESAELRECLQKEQEEAEGIRSDGYNLDPQLSVQALPTDLMDGDDDDDDDNDLDAFDNEFLVNDCPLQQEYFEWS